MAVRLASDARLARVSFFFGGAVSLPHGSEPMDGFEHLKKQS
jgi:hypothetical protein